MGKSLAFWLALNASIVAGPVAAAKYHAPRTSFGAPDLQGVWTTQSLTRLERPPEFRTLVVSAADLPAVNRKAAHDFANPTDDGVGQRATEFHEGADSLAVIDGQGRTSFIVDPADGRVPYTAEGRRVFQASKLAGQRDFAGPESRPAPERCLMASGGANGPPLLNAPFASNFQIVQTAQAVAILSEMNHDVRIVRLGGVHAPAAIRQWMGDSIGHWERDTLVVETINFHPQEGLRVYFQMSQDAKVIERFTRVSASQILYQFSVDDPKMFTQVWRGELPLAAARGPIFEYACHEGNYSLGGILAGARQAEAAVKSAQTTTLR